MISPDSGSPTILAKEAQPAGAPGAKIRGSVIVGKGLSWGAVLLLVLLPWYWSQLPFGGQLPASWSNLISLTALCAYCRHELRYLAANDLRPDVVASLPMLAGAMLGMALDILVVAARMILS